MRTNARGCSGWSRGGKFTSKPWEILSLVVKSCVAAWSTRWRRVHMSTRVRVLPRLTRGAGNSLSEAGCNLTPDGGRPRVQAGCNLTPDGGRPRVQARYKCGSFPDAGKNFCTQLLKYKILAFSLLFFFGFLTRPRLREDFFTVCMPNYAFFNKSHSN